MNCQEFQDWILESVDAPLEASRTSLLAEHISACASCARFREVQLALDLALVKHCAAPESRPGLSAAVRRRAVKEERRALWDAAPDLLHLGGGLAGTLVTAWLLPAPPVTVLAAGIAFTLLTYLPQTLFRDAIESADEL